MLKKMGTELFHGNFIKRIQPMPIPKKVNGKKAWKKRGKKPRRK